MLINPFHNKTFKVCPQKDVGRFFLDLRLILSDLGYCRYIQVLVVDTEDKIVRIFGFLLQLIKR